MKDTVIKGTGTAVNFDGMTIAGKTGTTSDDKDVWFAGYTPYYTAVTWTGYDNNIKMSNKADKALSKKIWRAVMQKIHENLPNQSFPIPEGIVQVAVCSQSGKLPVEGLCDNYVVTEYFAEGTEPVDSCDVHYSGDVCAYSLLPASPDCPFKLPGVLTLTPVEDISLQQGSTVINEDGTVSTPQTTNYCPHNEDFFLQPNYASVIEQQRAELLQRGYNFYH